MQRFKYIDRQVLDGWMNRCLNRWMDRWTDGQMDSWMDEQIDRWIDYQWGVQFTIFTRCTSINKALNTNVYQGLGTIDLGTITLLV